MSNSGGENFRHLSIFLSYGHDECDFRDMICEAIRARGHKVWFDAEQIVFNDSWRQKIEKGILTSDAVIGCLSKYSTRARSVCLDELSIAAGVRGGRNVYTLLLDKEDEVQPPSSVADRQWLDMSEWKTKRAQGDAVFKPWFAAKMQELFNTIESPENTEFSGQITTIKQNLTVCYGTGKRRKLLQNPFVGREWLTKKIAAWLDDETAPRTCFLYGAPGVGKSAFAAHYAHFNNRVVAALFLDSDMDFFNDPRTIIQTLAFLLACRLPEYRQMLMEYLTDNGREIPMMSEHELFSCLITEPFIHVIDGDHQSMVVVIDGLDETGDESNALANVLFRYTSQLPKWLRILVCGRDVPALHPLTETAAKIELPSGSPENISDIREFFCFRLEETFGSDPLWKNALNSMTARSEGIALYAQLLCDMLLDKKTLICDDFPKGLNGMFTMWFEHYIPDMAEFRNFFRPAICSILGAPGQTLPIPALRHVMEWCRAETNDFLLRLHVLLRRKADRFGEETVTFDHAFVRQWLSSKSAGKFYCPPEDGSELLAEKIYAAFEKDAAKLTMWEAAYLYAESTYYPSNIGGKINWSHILPEDQCQKITDSFVLEDKVIRAAEIDIEKGNLVSANTFFAEILDRTDDRLNRHSRNIELLHRKARCLNKYGYNLIEQCCYTDARNSFLECEKVLQELYQRTENAEDERNFLMNYIAIGDVIKAERGTEKNCQYYQKALNGMEKLTIRQEGIKYLPDLALCYERMGDIQETNTCASYWFEKERAIYEKQGTSNIIVALMNCNVRLGDCYIEQGDLKNAQQAYSNAYTNWNEYYKETKTPEAIQNQAILFDRAGDLFSRINENEKAQVYYCKSLELRKHLEKVRSTPKTRLELAVSYRQTALALWKDKKLEDAENYLRKEYIILEKLQKTAKSNDISEEWALCLSYMDWLYKKDNKSEETALLCPKAVDLEKTE